jgi:hypothetical protein
VEKVCDNRSRFCSKNFTFPFQTVENKCARDLQPFDNFGGGDATFVALLTKNKSTQQF